VHRSFAEVVDEIARAAHTLAGPPYPAAELNACTGLAESSPTDSGIAPPAPDLDGSGVSERVKGGVRRMPLAALGAVEGAQSMIGQRGSSSVDGTERAAVRDGYTDRSHRCYRSLRHLGDWDTEYPRLALEDRSYDLSAEAWIITPTERSFLCPRW